MIEAKSESQIQAECVRYMRNDLRVVYGTFFSVPNEGKRNPVNASRMIALGLLSGIPDLLWLVNQTIVFFELKTTKGRASAKQILIHDNLRAEGFEVYIVKSFEEFKNVVTLIIQRNPKT